MVLPTPLLAYNPRRMSDLTKSLLPEIRAHQLPGLDLGSDLVHPWYDGRSIVNIPSSVCQLLGAPALGSPPLASDLLQPLGSSTNNVVLLVIDGLALHRLQRWLAAGLLPSWQRLIERGLLAPLTSIAPSTTAAALTSLWTGVPAAQHGIVGYEMWLKEYGVMANMIEHRPITYHHDGELQSAGFDPVKFLPVETLGKHLQAHGAAPHAFQHYSIIKSGLSSMFMQDVQVYGYQTATELWISMRHLLENNPGERKYIWGYWGALDTLAHFKGPDNELLPAELSHFGQAFEQFFLDPLSKKIGRDTVVIITADHGHIATNPEEPRYQAANHEDLIRRLHLMPSGENRLNLMHVQPGQMDAVREYIQRTWPNQAIVLDAGHALRHGLFGLGEPYERVRQRLGDLVVVWRHDAYLWWATNKTNRLIGRHGGLSPDEMLVPLVAARLG